MITNTFCITFLFILINNCEGANILGVFPLSIKSHNIFLRSVVQELASKGHNLTIYTTIPTGKNITNITEIQVTDPIHDFMSNHLSMGLVRTFNGMPYFKPPPMFFMGLFVVYQILQDVEIRKLIHSNDKYDLILLESSFYQEGLLAFGHKFKAPVISLHPLSTMFSADEFVGNPFGLAHYPSFELDYTDQMTFFQRVHNVLRTCIHFVCTYTFYLPLQQWIMYWNFDYKGSETMPSLVNMLEDVSLVLANTQISVDYPRPLVPNVVGVGGLHISPTRQLLPKDLKEFMDNSKNGVVFMSFGSILPTDRLPEDLKQGFLKAFGRLRQNVLWKVADSSLTQLPKNVKTRKWIPQHDILGHPNCVTFITHGGMLSQQEAIYFGVPIIGIPFVADQHLNTNRAVKRGFAVNLSEKNITEESVFWAINEVLNNPMYRENVKKYSKIFRDNPISPADTVHYWVDYILRYKGAPYLRSEGRRLPYYKYLLLDVIAFFILLTILIISTMYLIFRFIYKKYFYKEKKCKVSFNKKIH